MSKQQLNVLIVDDNKGYTERMASMLYDIDTVRNVQTANNCQEATDLLVHEPDLVLLDINLPDRNGISLLKQIRESGTDCEVIMMTNHIGEYYKDACKKLGARFFLDKTHDFDLLPGILITMRN